MLRIKKIVLFTLSFLSLALLFEAPSSAAVKVAVLDTGISESLPVFRDRLGNLNETNRKALGSCSETARFADDQGHGTMVSGIIAELEPSAEILPIRFNGARENATEAKMICAVDLAIKLGAKIMNVSYGRSQNSPALEAAYARANDAGILVVVAAGNEFINRDRTPYYPANYTFSSLISVAAASNSGELLTLFADNWDYGTSYGPNTIDVAAPGDRVNIFKLDGTRARDSGTSLSAAHVSALAAKIWNQNPRLSAQEVKSRILNASTPITRSSSGRGGPYVRSGFVSIQN